MELKDGMEVYGSWKDGSDIYKNKKGYFIVQWDPKKETEYKKYLKKFTPDPNRPRLIFNGKTRKWKLIKNKTRRH